MKYFKDIKKDDKVWDPKYGWGSVHRITPNDWIVVNFPGNVMEFYNMDGIKEDEVNQTLYWFEIKPGEDSQTLYFDVKQLKFVNTIPENSKVKKSSIERLIRLVDNFDFDFIYENTVQGYQERDFPEYDILEINQIPINILDDVKQYILERSQMLYRKKIQSKLKEKITTYFKNNRKGDTK